MGGHHEIQKCEICKEGEIQRPGSKYCKVCSPIYFRIRGQAGFRNAPMDVLYKAVKLMRGMKSRSPCGRKPKYLMKGRNNTEQKKEIKLNKDYWMFKDDIHEMAC